jgi:hypothetical protein
MGKRAPVARWSGALIAFAIGALGWGGTLANLVPLDFYGALVVAVASGLLCGVLTRGGIPLVGFMGGYGGAWTAYVWYSGTIVGFEGLDALIVPIAILLVVAAAGGFVAGRVGRRLFAERARP